MAYIYNNPVVVKVLVECKDITRLGEIWRFVNIVQLAGSVGMSVARMRRIVKAGDLRELSRLDINKLAANFKIPQKTMRKLVTAEARSRGYKIKPRVRRAS